MLTETFKPQAGHRLTRPTQPAFNFSIEHLRPSFVFTPLSSRQARRRPTNRAHRHRQPAACRGEPDLHTMGKLYFHYSTMNAGKSTALLQANP